MPLSTPKNWWQPFNKEERIWLYISIAWGLIMFVMMPLGHFWNQNVSSETYKTDPEEYRQIADKFIAHYQRKDAKGEAITHNGKPGGIPLVDAPSKENGDVFLVAQAWQFRPVLVLKKNKTYRIHMSSLDYQHGFSLQPSNINLQVVPGYEMVITVTPNQAGSYSIVCNEFCGIGHSNMAGRIYVK